MLSELAWERRRLKRELADITRRGESARDFAATFTPIERAAEGEPGAFNLGGCWVKPSGPPLVEGGRMDVVGRRWLSSESSDRAEFYFAASQSVPMTFGDPASALRRLVVVGSMGAGKTEVLARWLVRMAFRFRNAAIGVVAPTHARLKILWRKVLRLLRPGWTTDIRVADAEIHLINGVRFEFVSAKEQSAAVGSPIAGKDWVAAGIDEEQDVSQGSLDELEMRGRDAPGGYFPVLSTCTLKDTPEWRTRKARYDEQPGCLVYRMTLDKNPFVDPDYIAGLAHSLSPRAYRMRVLALDAKPERAVFPEFERERHLRPRPLVGARDITSEVAGASILIGHDPGVVRDVSVMLKLYEVPGEQEPIWWVIDEVTTERTTSERHAAQLRRRLQERWRVMTGDDYSLGDAVVICDPHGESDNRPDQSAYIQFERLGFEIYSASGAKKKPIPRKARYELGSRLLCDYSDATRCYIDNTEGVAAQKLLEALEMAEYDTAGRFGQDKSKKSADLSDWIDAWLFGLWRFEKERSSWAVRPSKVSHL
jgi:hypothetical protein